MTILGWIALVMMLVGLVWAGIDIGKDARRYPLLPRLVRCGMRTSSQRRKFDLSRLKSMPREPMSASWKWYSWGMLGSKIPNWPGVYRLTQGSRVYIGQSASVSKRIKSHLHSERLGDWLYLQKENIEVWTMEEVILKGIRGYGLENSLVREALEGMAILEARMSGQWEVMNFNLT